MGQVFKRDFLVIHVLVTHGTADTGVDAFENVFWQHLVVVHTNKS